MYYYGQEEIDALEQVIRSGVLFRYHEGSKCEEFERRYAEFLGSKYFSLAVSGSFAISAGLMGLEIGPGDEVLVPAHTYMATATSVLAVGAIPVIVDIDETITISPEAIRDAIGPHTRAIIPVHMWGAACDMDAIMEIAEEHKLLVLEDVCQGIGGSYKGRKLGSIGHAGAFSFNYFKNMSGGEGGGSPPTMPRSPSGRAAPSIPAILLAGPHDAIKPFAGIGARASEFMGAHAQRAARPARRHDFQHARGEDAGSSPAQASRQSGTEAQPDEQPGRRLRHACDVPAAKRCGGGCLCQGYPRHHCRQDRPPHLYAMGPGADARGRGASGAQSLQSAGKSGCRTTYSRGMCKTSLDILTAR